ncbi:anti-CBASS protein Acb1 family protein [Yersinia enterocolitica]
MANSDTQMKRPYPPLSFVNEFRPHIELVPATEVLEWVNSQILSDEGAGTPESQGRYEQKNAQFTGLSDVITKMATVLAGALDRPITVLFGQSSSGFSSGEEDNKAYYETINGMQESRLRPMQDFADQFILDKLSVAENLTYEYPSIDSINEAEEATRFGLYATGFNTLVTSSIVTEEVAIREMIARGVLKTVTEEEIQGIVSAGSNTDSWGSYGTPTVS